MKIVITDGSTVFDSTVKADVFNQYGQVVCYPLTSQEELLDRIRDADILLCNKTQIGKQEMDAAKNLKYIGIFATGYNNVDTAYARQKGITVCNAPGYSTEAVAQHAFALMLQVMNRIGDYNRIVSQGDWIKSPSFTMFPFPLYELSGKTLGIVGYGAIGKQVAAIANAFRMRILVHNRSRIQDETVTQVPLDTLLQESDIVSLHCPLNSDSANMMNADAFAKMKQGAVLINTARGPLVDEYALRDALISGKRGCSVQRAYGAGLPPVWHSQLLYHASYRLGRLGDPHPAGGSCGRKPESLPRRHTHSCGFLMRLSREAIRSIGICAIRQRSRAEAFCFCPGSYLILSQR